MSILKPCFVLSSSYPGSTRVQVSRGKPSCVCTVKCIINEATRVESSLIDAMSRSVAQ